MKKKVFSLALVICCLAVFIASSTLAYFTKEDTATNVITTGKIDIDLVEKMVDPESGDLIVIEKDDETGEEDDQENIEFNVKGVMPGQKVVKIVYVENKPNAQDAWVRINLTKSIVLADGTEGDSDLLEITFNTTDWTAREDNDGLWYYYNKPLKAGKETVPLMESVVFSKEADNKYQDATAEIIVLAQAVQVKNNGVSALDAQGWPSVAGEE